MKQLSAINSIVLEAQKSNLYSKLIEQLNKDLLRANVELQFSASTKPTDLVNSLNTFVHELIVNRFDDYLNLLYIIDVPEHKVKQIKAQKSSEISKHITFLIVSRIWQKVWLKSKY